MIAEPIADLPLKRWTVEEYHRMIAAGIFAPGQRLELLDGQIIEMIPQEPPHASQTSSISNDFVLWFASKAWIRCQLPVTLSENSEPEPDIAVVRIDPNRYRDRHPSPSDIFLIIEIADSTLSYDRNRKAKLYAKANIPEYWIVNLNQRQVIVLRQPEDQQYQIEQILQPTDSIAPLAFPEIVIDLERFQL